MFFFIKPLHFVDIHKISIAIIKSER